MNPKPCMFWFLIFTLTTLGGCSSQPDGKESKKAAAPLHKVQGKLQVVQESNSTDAALNAGGPSLFIRDGVRRYRLFLKSQIEVTPDKEYVAEGIYAQKAIDEIRYCAGW